MFIWIEWIIMKRETPNNYQNRTFDDDANKQFNRFEKRRNILQF